MYSLLPILAIFSLYQEIHAVLLKYTPLTIILSIRPMLTFFLCMHACRYIRKKKATESNDENGGRSGNCVTACYALWWFSQNKVLEIMWTPAANPVHLCTLMERREERNLLLI